MSRCKGVLGNYTAIKAKMPPHSGDQLQAMVPPSYRGLVYLGEKSVGDGGAL